MTEEQKIFAGKLFCPGDPALRALKLKAHNLCTRYNATFEDETEIRTVLLSELFGSLGAGSFLQGPIYVHYGCHTTIGERFFGNFNLTIQDDARVTIGNDCNFGPGATIVTPVHPMLPDERKLLKLPEHINWDAVLQSLVDTWLPLLGIAAAILMVLLTVFIIRRNRRHRNSQSR